MNLDPPYTWFIDISISNSDREHPTIMVEADTAAQAVVKAMEQVQLLDNELLHMIHVSVPTKLGCVGEPG